jgi:hypothetical protein
MTEAEPLERIAALERAVADLRAKLDGPAQPPLATMARTLRCPGCGGTRLLHFRRIADNAGSVGAVQMAVQQIVSKWTGTVAASHGIVEAFGCRGCRLIEWHAVTFDDVVVDNNMVVEIDGSQPPPPPNGPFR